MGKDIRFEEAGPDKTKPGLFAIGPYAENDLTSVSQVYQQYLAGKIPAGHYQLIGRLPEILACWSDVQFKVTRYERIGAKITASVLRIQPKYHGAMRITSGLSF